jgi:hypothetical protein
MKPEKLEHAEIELIARLHYIHCPKMGVAEAFAKAIEAEVNARWEAMLAAQEPVAWGVHCDHGWIPVLAKDQAEKIAEGFSGRILQLYAAPVQQENTALLRQALQALTLLDTALDLQSFPDIYVQVTYTAKAIKEALK